ncbi:hypothetical protein TIFTF001_011047 [Ficus carica]|uniref:Uncharacterized protein n=1 Tax=Ficus carica TaxID=3494 RepID=A0AA88ADB5_FICCA|nr:hypothetical protein TIFTF001_011047 [Ficus carica]
MSKISGTTSDVIARTKLDSHSYSAAVHLKMEASQSDGDTSGVSAMGTPMFKSVTVLMSKQRSRVLPQSEQAAEVDDGIGAIAGYAMSGGGLSIVIGHRRQHARGTTCEGRPVRVNNIVPGYFLT